MAPEEIEIAEKRASVTPYQLDPEQTLKAATALLAHIKKEQEKRSTEASKKYLLKEGAALSEDDEDVDEDGEPIWLVLTTKKFIVDKTRLKPGKIPLPHSIHSSEARSICLFTCDPATPYKEILQHPTFPPSLSQRITQTIPIVKLKTQYKPFETRRQLLAQHDLFLADDRIVTYLPALLGKTFYKSGSKRPIPINLSPKPERVDGKRVKKDKKHALTPRTRQGDRAHAQVAIPHDAAKEIEKALSATTVQLSPSTSTMIRIGRSGKGWTAEMLQRNIEVAVEQLVEKWVPGKWRGVRALYVKGERSASLPIWMAEQLWEGEEDVLEGLRMIEKKDEDEQEHKEVGEIEDRAGGKVRNEEQNREKNKKRKADDDEHNTRKRRRRRRKNEGDTVGTDAATSKLKLEKQKKAAMAEIEA